MEFDVVIIGGGVVGLACAAESTLHGFSTLLIERHASFGQETSSRNSEVIHSGIYYPTGSLKARLCVAANKKIYAECDRSGVWTNRCGKLIVAVTPEEEQPLNELYNRGVTNGVEGMQLLDVNGVKKLEPNIKCHSAIFLPSTGIIDSHELMKSYLHEAKSRGCDTAFGVEFIAGERKNNQFELLLKDTNGDRVEMNVKYVINSGGLWSDKVAQGFGIDIDAAGYRLHHNRGHYYTVSSSNSKLISHLVYPIPHQHLVSVGIHISIDKAGQVKLGPDHEFIHHSIPESDWYKFDPDVSGRREKFHSAVIRYFPALKLEDLSPGQVGVRPKIKGSEHEVKDFIIQEESGKGMPGLVNLIGIESPGLTCAREIARLVFQKIEEIE